MATRSGREVSDARKNADGTLAHSAVNPFASGQHLHKHGDPPGTRLRFFGGLHPPQNRITVRTVQFAEETTCFGSGGECPLQIRRHLCRSSAIVGGVPSAVGSCPGDFRHSMWLHPTGLDQRLRSRAIRLRPQTARAPGREALEPVSFVERLFLPVDPPMAKRHLHGLWVTDGRLFRACLGDQQPGAIGRRMVLFHPGLECALRGKTKCFLGWRGCLVHRVSLGPTPNAEAAVAARKRTFMSTRALTVRAGTAETAEPSQARRLARVPPVTSYAPA